MNNMYERLSAIPFLSKSYTFKFLFIAFLGIHIPLIGLIVFILFRPEGLSAYTVLGLTLVLTLAATGVTLFILNGLLQPLRKSRQALQEYTQRRTLPTLPTQFADEAGQLMQHLQFTLTELNDLLEEKKDLTALLSHDLRIPLQNVKTLSRHLQQPTDPEEVQEIAGMIRESAEEQAKLLEEILTILRQEHLFYAGMQNQKVKTEDLVAEVFDSFKNLAADKNITLQAQVQYTGAVEVQPELFRQVLKNLVSNAIKFSHPGTAVVVRVYQKENKTFFEVEDAGLGFEPAVAERLFDRFTKSGRKGTAGEPSTGIGLYLSRKIIKHHKGQLVACSKGAGTGATFSICLN